MQQPLLFSRFSYALSWNAFLYLAHRILSTALVFVLYRSVPTNTFATWTTITSMIYLALLWLDLGFRKSIPRYAPVFSTHNAFTLFSKTVLLFQVTVLFLAAPFFYYGMPLLFTWILHSSTGMPSTLRLTATALFITEGLTEILRLLYHSHFLNKPFNLLTTTTRLIDSTSCIVLLTYTTFSSSHLLILILLIKLLCGLIGIIAALYMLPMLYAVARQEHVRHHTTTIRPLWKAFAKHSSVMWISNVIKSFSERNFLLPVLTYTLGAEQAGIFKLAQDSALFFERSVIKTIGTADTALLAHVEAEEKEKGAGDRAFKKLTRNVAGLCIPLFGILVFLFLEGKSYIPGTDVFQLFILLTATYLVEVLVSPYERVLEVKQRYLLLGLAYVPYVIGLFLILYSRAFIGLVSFIVVLQGVRLVSSFCMMGFVSYYYRLRFPLAFTLGWFTVATVGAVGAWAVTFWFRHTI